jgi:acetoin utilization deacetylase AcuC-like enzyme
MQPTAAVWSEAFLEPGEPRDEIEDPWSADHVAAIWREFSDLSMPYDLIEPLPAADAVLELVHPPEYIAAIREYSNGTRIRRDDFSIVNADTAIRSNTFDLARLGAGAMCTGIDAVMTGRFRNAFVVARPGDHHAYATRGCGFCIFNHTAIGARYLQTHHAQPNVLIIDWDVHHGNGTQAIFYSDPTVYFYSIHGYGGFYPGTGHETERGSGAGQGATLNVPLPARTEDHTFLRAFRHGLDSIRFKPDFILITAGFDGHRDDPVGNLSLSSAVYPELTRLVMEYADEHCAARIVSFLAGGYNLETYGALAASHVAVLAGDR